MSNYIDVTDAYQANVVEVTRYELTDEQMVELEAIEEDGEKQEYLMDKGHRVYESTEIEDLGTYNSLDIEVVKRGE